MPGPKNGERPYLAPSVPLFSGLFFSLFRPIFPAIQHPTHPDDRVKLYKLH